MASFFEKITVAIDLQTAKASAGFRDLKTSISEAEGFTGKLKAGASGLTKSLGGLVSGLGPAGVAGAAAAAGAALWAAGEKFVDLARQSRDLAIATGLSTEEASRLIDVFGDLGGDAGSLASSIGKITKDLDADKWKKYGIAVRDAGGNARPTQEIFLEALETLRRIKDPTLRAAAGTELFGKSWANLAPLIAKSNSELEDMISNVKDAKAITDEEAKSAEELAAAQDAIKDVIEDLTLEVGKLVAELAPLIPLWEMSMKPLEYGVKAIGWAAEQSTTQVKAIAGAAKDLWDDLFGPSDAEKRLEEYRKVAEDVPPVLVEIGDRNKEAAQAAWEHADKAEKLAEVLSGRRDSLARRAYEAETRLRHLREEIEGARDWNTVKQGLLDYGATLKTLADDLANERITEEEYTLAREQATLDAKDGVLDYLDTLSKVPPEVASSIVAKIDAGAFAEVQAMLDSLKQREVAITPVGGITPQARGEQGIGVGGTYITVNVSGALDANGTATTIKRILDDHSRAVGNQVVWS